MPRLAKEKNKLACRRIKVKLDKRSYYILIQPGIINLVGEHLLQFGFSKRIGIVTNPTVGKYYVEPVECSLLRAGFKPKLYSIPDGEEYKNLDVVRDIYTRLVLDEFDRNSALIALGGGVIGDITGFVAATYLRGIPFIQIPTTLLAQVDSSVGGKVGVNLPLGKNLIGSFYQPKLVLTDPNVLFTLPEREFRAGLAEVVKYGVIYDAVFFAWLERNISNIKKLDASCLTYLITRCCQIKAEVISQDETEQGLRAILNFGHTIGHAIETLTNYTQYRHGEAVAIGMVAAGKLAHNLSLFDRHQLQRLQDLLVNIGLPIQLPHLAISKFLDTIYRDKKVRNQKLRMVLPKKIGLVTLVDNISENKLKKIIHPL
ncbi:MAG: 3-dehydroquinate synthase [bacterium]|nr:3-dehydroquinate synthase [bacterium]